MIEPPALDGPPPWDRAEPGPFRFDAMVRRRDGPTTAVISLHRFNLLGREVMLVVARDVAEERRREQEQAGSLRQIQRNMEQFQILNDQIRNPVQVIIGLADMEGGDFGSRIIRQAHEIDEIVRQLDVGWLESAKVSAYLRRYGDLSFAPSFSQSRSWSSRAAPRTRNPIAASGQRVLADHRGGRVARGPLDEPEVRVGHVADDAGPGPDHQHERDRVDRGRDPARGEEGGDDHGRDHARPLDRLDEGREQERDQQHGDGPGHGLERLVRDPARHDHGPDRARADDVEDDHARVLRPGEHGRVAMSRGR